MIWGEIKGINKYKHTCIVLFVYLYIFVTDIKYQIALGTQENSMTIFRKTQSLLLFPLLDVMNQDNILRLNSTKSAWHQNIKLTLFKQITELMSRSLPTQR